MITVFLDNIGNAGVVIFLVVGKIDGQQVHVLLEQHIQLGRRVHLIQAVNSASILDNVDASPLANDAANALRKGC